MNKTLLTFLFVLLAAPALALNSSPEPFSKAATPVGLYSFTAAITAAANGDTEEWVYTDRGSALAVDCDIPGTATILFKIRSASTSPWRTYQENDADKSITSSGILRFKPMNYHSIRLNAANLTGGNVTCVFNWGP